MLRICQRAPAEQTKSGILLGQFIISAFDSEFARSARRFNTATQFRVLLSVIFLGISVLFLVFYVRSRRVLAFTL